MRGFLLTTLVPLLGNILGCLLNTSPAPAMLTIRKNNSLGELNALPYPMILINAVGWVGYGYVGRNPWVLPGNIWGAVCGFVYTFTAYGVVDAKTRDMMMLLVTLSALYFIVLGTISSLVLTQAASLAMWGISCNAILVVFYIAPLATLVKIIRTRDAASIYMPIAIMTILNGSTWTAYGLAIADPNIWPINGFGAIVGVVQVLLKVMYPSGKKTAAAGIAGGAEMSEASLLGGPSHARTNLLSGNAGSFVSYAGGPGSTGSFASLSEAGAGNSYNNHAAAGRHHPSNLSHVPVGHHDDDDGGEERKTGSTVTTDDQHSLDIRDDAPKDPLAVNNKHNGAFV